MTRALELAQQAFQHPSMVRDSTNGDCMILAFVVLSQVAMLYFPDEHKLAVYMPYFLPVLLPFFQGLFGEIKRVRDRQENPSTSVANLNQQ